MQTCWFCRQNQQPVATAHVNNFEKLTVHIPGLAGDAPKVCKKIFVDSWCDTYTNQMVLLKSN